GPEGRSMRQISEETPPVRRSPLASWEASRRMRRSAATSSGGGGSDGILWLRIESLSPLWLRVWAVFLSSTQSFTKVHTEFHRKNLFGRSAPSLCAEPP